uniref:Cation-transporting P-type ATPase C-terminal domain-containing protein n=1 Tax=Salix viminalis TaxID=40686 RepID=A0A6N2MU61_SALVM
MGIQGTEVAKESSDIVILDDNFASVATVLRWGRCVYNNIQKFIQFQLTVNVAALVINFVAAVSAGEVPLTAVQLLWVNLIMDTLGALALATEQPTQKLMEKSPVGRTEPLITNIILQSVSSSLPFPVDMDNSSGRIPSSGTVILSPSDSLQPSSEASLWMSLNKSMW